MGASREGHLEVVEALLGAGANVNLETETGKTALSYASEARHQEVVRALTVAIEEKNRGKGIAQ